MEGFSKSATSVNQDSGAEFGKFATSGDINNCLVPQRLKFSAYTLIIFLI